MMSQSNDLCIDKEIKITHFLVTLKAIKKPREMKQPKEMSVLVKDLSIRNRREVREGSLQITTTIVFSLSIAFFIVIMGIFISDHLKKFILSDDFYSTLSSSSSIRLCNSSLSSSSPPASPSVNFSSTARGLGDWIAPKELWHSMSDKELTWHASIIPHIVDYPYNRTPKVAFMFLTRGRLPLGAFWERFFKGHDGLFSIYLHTSPEFTDEPPESSVFYKRRIPSKPVEWGRVTMIDAERRLLANALLDFSNERFVLLSETCIPVFNFTTVYNYLINSNHSFLGSFDDPRPMGRGRYNKRMWPIVSLSDWRKGSQWFEVHRKLAIEIVSDEKYYQIFRLHCGPQCRPPCYMDEHYLATLVTKIYPELSSNRSITWVDWSKGGSHPTRFVRNHVSVAFLKRIQDGFNCSYNGNPSSICFLFARKFHPNTLEPLLRIAPALLGFDP